MPRGQTVTFTATVANTTGVPAFSNTDAVNIAVPLKVNDTKFFTNFPSNLGAGQVFTAPIFDVMVPWGTTFLAYPGEFDILGGSDLNAQNPEPRTLISALANLGASASGAYVRVLNPGAVPTSNR